MSLRALLATSWIAVTLGVFAACNDGGEPAEQIPDDAVQSDEAAPSQPSPEDSL
jgi:hypothetical protein